MAYKTFRRFEVAVDEAIYQKAQALYLDHGSASSMAWEDENGNTTTLTIPNREIIPFGVYKIKTLPSGTLFILY